MMDERIDLELIDCYDPLLTQRLKDDHKGLVLYLTKVRAKAELIALANKGRKKVPAKYELDIRRNLNRFYELLNKHLGAENGILYYHFNSAYENHPEATMILEENNNRSEINIITAVKKMKMDMVDIQRRGIIPFLRSWPAARIFAEAEEFCKESEGLLVSLANRIKYEEEVTYEEYDKIPEKIKRLKKFDQETNYESPELYFDLSE